MEKTTDRKHGDRKQIIFTEGAKGGGGKTTLLSSLADFFLAESIPVKLVDADIDNKSRGSLSHLFKGNARAGDSTRRQHVSASDRSIQILEDIKDPRRAHYIFKILLTGVQPAYQVAHPGEKDHTNVDRAAWISTFEEALAKAIVQIVLSRQAEQASQAVGSPKE